MKPTFNLIKYQSLYYKTNKNKKKLFVSDKFSNNCCEIFTKTKLKSLFNVYISMH